MSDEQEKPKKRARGLGSVYQHGTSWWVKYYVRGKCHRERAGKTRASAIALLKQRIGEVATGRFNPDGEKVTFDDLMKLVEQDYIKNRNRSWSHAKRAFDLHLRPFFGRMRAVDIDAFRLDAYVAHRLEEKAAPATVKNELAQLKRSMNLAHRVGRLTVKPAFPLIRTDNPRTGFVTEEQMRAILRELPTYLRPLGLFGWYAGWRSREVSGLMCKNVDMANGMILLEAENSKNRRARPF